MDLADRAHLIGIFGSPNSGKSWLVRDIIFEYSKFINLIIIITGSAFNKFYHHFIKKEYIHDGFKEEVISSILEFCEDAVKTNKNFKTLVVFDDIQGANYDTPIMKVLINNHRHYNLSVIVAQQYVRNISLNFRSNISIAFISKQVNRRVIDALFESFGNGLELVEFKKLLNRVTSEKFTFLGIENMTPNPFYKYRAEDRNFKFVPKLK